MALLCLPVFAALTDFPALRPLLDFKVLGGFRAFTVFATLAGLTARLDFMDLRPCWTLCPFWP